MKSNKNTKIKNPLVGTWKCGDGFSDVEISVDFKEDTPTVSVIDKYDDEVPKIFEVLWDAEKGQLNFGTLWSTGRFVQYTFMSSPIDGRAGVTFTYTDQELWVRE